jgi:CBS domain-containing protein
MLHIKDVMTPQAEVISPDATTEQAASVMKTLDIGVLPVCDEEGLVGILTDRDLVVRVVAASRDERAAATMAGQQIRRLPVLDKNRQLVGIVSMGDIAVHAQNHQLTGKVLEDVSQPSEPKRGEGTHEGEGFGQAA